MYFKIFLNVLMADSWQTLSCLLKTIPSLQCLLFFEIFFINFGC
jgi:hypothetical protein